MNPIHRLFRIAFALFVAVGFVALSGCESEEPNAGVTLSDIADDPQAYFGQTVTVSGEIDEVLGMNAFVIGADDLDDDLLIVSADPIPVAEGRMDTAPFAEGDEVRATGIVEAFRVADLEAKYGFDLDDGLFGGYDGLPVLVAARSSAALSSITVTPGAGTPVDVSAMNSGTITDLMMIVDSDDPTMYLDRAVELQGVEVQDVVSDKGFWVGPNAETKIFAWLDQEPTPGDATEGRYDINTGSRWILMGTLRAMPDDEALMSSWGLSEDLVASLEGERVYFYVQRAEQTQES